MGPSFPSSPATWNLEVMAGVAAAILDSEDKGKLKVPKLLMTKESLYSAGLHTLKCLYRRGK